LIKLALNNLPIYYLSMFPIPASVAANIERMIRSFLDLFSGLVTRVERNRVMLNGPRLFFKKKHRGLGIGSIRSKSKFKSV